MEKESNNTLNFQMEFNEIIEKHLPLHLSKSLKNKLDELEYLTDRNNELSSKLELCKSDNEKLHNQISELEQKINNINFKEEEYLIRQAKLDLKERELIHKEIKVDIEIAKREMAEKHSSDFKEVMTTVFSNKTVFENIHKCKSGHWNYNSKTGMNEFTPDGNETTTITKS